jgi:DNA-binding CsgD family transcriptional regulator
MAQGGMPAARTLQQSLRELRRCARGASRRPPRISELKPLIDRMLACGEAVSIEERDGAVWIRLRASDATAGYALTCVIKDADHFARLTRCEYVVAEHLCNGLTLAQIARLRGVSINTIKSQARNVFRKLDVESRVALVRRLGP